MASEHPPEPAARPPEGSARMGAVSSPIIPIVAEWIRAHPGTISLGQGVVSYGPPAQCGVRVTEFFQNPENHKYKAVEGLPELRALLASKLASENGLRLGQGTELLITAGSNMGFMNAMLAVTDPGDEVILQSPFYFNHEMAVTLAGGKPVPVATDEQFQLQPDRIRAALSSRTRAVVTISPNNPSGTVYTEDSLRAVNRMCAEHGLYHIHDEAYEYFLYDGARAFSPGSVAGASAHTIGLYSLSKAYGFASWRIGYMTLPAALMESMKKIQDTILICPPVVSQMAALGALEAGAAYCRDKLREITEVRRVVLQALREVGDRCVIPKADGAFYLLLRLNTTWDSLELARRLIEEEGVAVIPGRAFGLSKECCLRVAYGALSLQTAREGIGRLVNGLKRLVAV